MKSIVVLFEELWKIYEGTIVSDTRMELQKALSFEKLVQGIKEKRPEYLIHKSSFFSHKQLALKSSNY